MNELIRPVRADFRYFHSIGTRWSDNDSYGHVNNVVYHSFFDTAVNAYLIERGLLEIHLSSHIGLVVRNCCNYFSSVAFPDRVTVGVRVQRLGTSSVTYALGLFREDEVQACASGEFVHVYVDRVSRRPVPFTPLVREALSAL